MLKFHGVSLQKKRNLKRKRQAIQDSSRTHTLSRLILREFTSHLVKLGPITQFLESLFLLGVLLALYIAVFIVSFSFPSGIVCITVQQEG